MLKLKLRENRCVGTISLMPHIGYAFIGSKMHKAYDTYLLSENFQAHGNLLGIKTWLES